MSRENDASTLGALTEGVVDEARLNANWRAIAARRRAPAPSRAPWKLAGALAAAAAVTLFVLAQRPSAPGALTLADGGAFGEAGRVEGPVVALSDGSRLQLGADAALEVLESSGQRVALRLAQGHVRFEVTPGGPRRWVIEAGAQVEVVGTVFSVRRGGARVDVEVERGVVLVRHGDLPDGVARLTAGQSVTVGAQALAAQALAEPDPVARRSDEPAEHAEDSAPDEPVEATPEAHAPRRAIPRRPSADTLWDRADAARADGDPEAAARWLGQLLDAHPRDARASMAAVTLGRLSLRRLDRPGEAADAFARALRLGLPPSLAEDTRAMRVEALARAGHPAEAREAADEYHHRHPEGRWAEQVTRWAPGSR